MSINYGYLTIFTSALPAIDATTLDDLRVDGWGGDGMLHPDTLALAEIDAPSDYTYKFNNSVQHGRAAAGKEKRRQWSALLCSTWRHKC